MPRRAEVERDLQDAREENLGLREIMDQYGRFRRAVCQAMGLDPFAVADDELLVLAHERSIGEHFAQEEVEDRTATVENFTSVTRRAQPAPPVPAPPRPRSVWEWIRDPAV
jgi:hypothetical protein